jgi:tetratricopeptide (TPR) repeat protein
VPISIQTFNFRLLLCFLLTGSCLFAGGLAHAQQKVNIDSIRQARQHVLDSTRQEQKRILDSARTARQHVTDSITAVRKHFSDSLAAVRAYRSSKHYKDSVASVRKHRLDSMKAERQAVFDSMRAARQRVTDSLIAARKHTTDSIRAVQKHRADSLGVIREYRQSKRYRDSVAFVRQQRLDSMRTARKAFNDSLIAVRKKSLDSAAAVRKHYNDSVSTVRKRFTDSLKTVRQARTDSLAKIKEARERLKKSKEKLNEDKMKLALELKIKKKHEAWSNEKMLKKKWSAPRRLLQNTFTHYNYYFNADKKMDEALANMQRMNKENYDSLIALFPFDPDRDSTKLAPDMDSIIQKASVGIQIHDPRTKWGDDLYLLLGHAYYYKGNYNEAATAFRYIVAMNQQQKMKDQKKAAAKKKTVSKEVSIVENDKGGLDFLKHKSVNNEAILWLARTYTEAHKENDAESVLDLIETDKNLPDKLKGRIALEKAYLNLGRNDYKTASDNLALVAADEELPDWIRTRASYLNGQIQYSEGNYADAAKDFQSVIDMQPKIEMDFYARKNLAYSLIGQGGDQQTATVALRRMLNDGKYIPYYEQIYYVLGRLSSNGNRPDEAIENFQKSIASSKSTRKQKALSFAGLGDVYYSKGSYRAAKVAYDSAATYGRSMAAEETIATAIKRNKVLDKVVVPIEIINKQDSLLALAAMSEKEQKQVVRRYIKDLQKQKEDSAFNAANGNTNAPLVNNNDPGNSGGDWYFSSTVAMQQGYNDFKRKWGSRQNVDNWRRVGGIAFNSNNAANEASDTEASTETDENGLPTESSLLAAIPTSTEAQSKAKQQIQKAYMDLATAYVKDLEDYPRGAQTLDTLDKRFAANEQKAEELYLRYQIALKQNKLDEAQRLSEQLRKEFAETKWAKEVAPKEEPQGLLASVPVGDYYDETYGLMMQRQYGQVLERVREGQKRYTDPVYNNRFRIMEAIALAGSGYFDQADSVLSSFISTHPTDSLRSWADVVMNYVKKNKPAVPKSTIKDSTGVNAVNNDTTTNTAGSFPANVVPGSNAPAPTAYTYNPSASHYFIFLFNKMESKAMGVKAALGDFNTFNYGSQHLKADITMLQQGQGIITVNAFPSAAHAKIYLNSVKANNLILKEYSPSEYTLVIISADNYKKLRADHDITPYLKFYKANYK